MARLSRIIMYMMALLLVLLAPLLGLAAAAVGAWHAILAGSNVYLPMRFLLMPVTFVH